MTNRATKELVDAHGWKFCKKIQLFFTGIPQILKVLNGESNRDIIYECLRDEWSTKLRYIADRFTRVDQLVVDCDYMVDCEELVALASRLTLRSISFKNWGVWCEQTALMIRSKADSLTDLKIELNNEAKIKNWRTICSALSSCHQLTSLHLTSWFARIGFGSGIGFVRCLADALKDKAKLQRLHVHDISGRITQEILNPSVHRLTHLTCDYKTSASLLVDERFGATLRTLEYFKVTGHHPVNFRALVQRVAPRLVPHQDRCWEWSAQ